MIDDTCPIVYYSQPLPCPDSDWMMIDGQGCTREDDQQGELKERRVHGGRKVTVVAGDTSENRMKDWKRKDGFQKMIDRQYVGIDLKPPLSVG